MIKRLTALLATMVVAILSLAAINSPAQAAPKPAANPVNATSCGASDRSDVRVDKKTDTVTVFADPSTAGNNFYCYTNIPVQAGDLVTFSFIGTCGGGVPRVFLQFDGGASDGENTFDTGMCSMTSTSGGTASYAVTKAGTITAFAEIHDIPTGSTTYSNLVIADTRINF